MRFILAVLLTLSAFAQQPPAPAKPEAQAPLTPAAAAEAAAPQTKPAEATKSDDKAASPAPSTESWINGYVDLGYRWVTDVRGNVQQYRSVVNLGEGPKVLGFDLTLQDPKKRAFDTLTLRGIGWGGDPYTTAYLNARKMKLYDLRLDYRNIAYFNAIPSFANPNQPAGYNERTFDTRRRQASFELDLFPGSHFVPYLAFDRNSGHGRGIETWVLGAADEFPVPYSLRDSTDSYRGGVRVDLKRFHVTLEQGGTNFKQDDGTNYTGPNAGDRTTPIGGSTINLGSLYQSYRIRGTSLYSRVLMTARPTNWMNVYGQFLYSQPKTNVDYTEIATGRLYDFTTATFFPGLYNLAAGNAVQPHVSGNVGVEINYKRLRVIESLTTDRRHDSAFGLFSPQVYQAFLTAPSSSTAPRQVIRYNQIETNVLFDVTSKLTLRGGHRYYRGDATVLAGNLSQVGPSVAGEMNRQVGLAGLSYRPSLKLSFNADYEGASSDRVYVRTSLNEYHRARARAKWQATGSLMFQANFRILDNQNPAPDIRFDYRSRDASASVFWTPAGGKRVSFTGEYDRSSWNSDIRYLDLPFLTPATSSYRDIAHTATAAVDIVLPGVKNGKLTAGGSLFISRGSRPTQYYQPVGRLSLPLHKNLMWNTEWQYYGFGEQFYFFEGFRTHIFMTGLRLTR
jgi:hypothetical protein